MTNPLFSENLAISTKSAPRGALAQLLGARSKQLGVSLSQIALDAGMTRAYLHRLASGGVANPGVLTLQRLALALKIPASAVFRLFVNEALQGEADLARHATRHLALLDSRDALVFAGDLTIPDHSVVLPGERFTKTWSIQNAGSVPWPERRLMRQDEDLVIARRLPQGGLQALLDSHLDSLGRSIAVPPAQSGQVIELSVDFAAPLENCSVASVWRFESMQGEPIYRPHCFLQVVVTVLGG